MTTVTQLLGTRFGAIEYTDEDVVTFPAGPIGFPQLNQFVLIAPREGSAFRWLQSLDEPVVAFLLADPNAFVDSYSPTISSQDAEQLKLDAKTPHLTFTTASIREGGKEITLNLLAPIVLNLEARIGKQVVLEGDAYNIRHRIVPMANPSVQMAA